MTKAEALKLANDMVTEWSGQVKNERGYVHDKWQPVSLESRTRAVIELADFLYNENSNAHD